MCNSFNLKIETFAGRDKSYKISFTDSRNKKHFGWYSKESIIKELEFLKSSKLPTKVLASMNIVDLARMLAVAVAR